MTLKTSDREIQCQYDVRIMLRNTDYKQARALRATQIDSKARKVLCTSENLQKYYCREKMAPTVQQLSAELMTEAEREAEEDRFLRKSKQSPFIPIGE